MRLGFAGTGRLGSQIMYTSALGGRFEEIVVYDIVEKLADAQARDANQAIVNESDCRVYFGEPWDCDIVVVTAGRGRKVGETREQLAIFNAGIMKNIAGKIKEANKKDQVVITLSNPMDVNNYLLWKETGKSREKIIGSGPMLDSARFTYILSKKYKVPPTQIAGYVIGQHGEYQVPYFSGVSFKDDKKEFSEEEMKEIRELLRKEAIEIIEGKGATEFAPARTTTALIHSVAENRKIPLLVSAVLQGEYKLDGLSIGVPAIIGKEGIKKILEWRMNKFEQELFQKGAEEIKALISKL